MQTLTLALSSLLLFLPLIHAHPPITYPTSTFTLTSTTTSPSAFPVPSGLLLPRNLHLHDLLIRDQSSQTITTPPSQLLTQNPSCLILGEALSICQSITPNFVSLAPSDQAKCLCYSYSSSDSGGTLTGTGDGNGNGGTGSNDGEGTAAVTGIWQPNVFDGAVSGCTEYAVSQIGGSVVSVLGGLVGFCQGVGNVEGLGTATGTGDQVLGGIMGTGTGTGGGSTDGGNSVVVVSTTGLEGGGSLGGLSGSTGSGIAAASSVFSSTTVESVAGTISTSFVSTVVVVTSPASAVSSLLSPTPSSIILATTSMSPASQAVVGLTPVLVLSNSGSMVSVSSLQPLPSTDPFSPIAAASISPLLTLATILPATSLVSSTPALLPPTSSAPVPLPATTLPSSNAPLPPSLATIPLPTTTPPPQQPGSTAACNLFSSILSTCTISTTSFTLLPLPQQAKCLCFITNIWVPNAFDGAVAGCWNSDSGRYSTEGGFCDRMGTAVVALATTSVLYVVGATGSLGVTTGGSGGGQGSGLTTVIRGSESTAISVTSIMVVPIPASSSSASSSSLEAPSLSAVDTTLLAAATSSQASSVSQTSTILPPLFTSPSISPTTTLKPILTPTTTFIELSPPSTTTSSDDSGTSLNGVLQGLGDNAGGTLKVVGVKEVVVVSAFCAGLLTFL